MKCRVRRTTHKYGVELPRDVKHARYLDKVNGNTFWMDALAKEMYNVGVAALSHTSVQVMYVKL